MKRLLKKSSIQVSLLAFVSFWIQAWAWPLAPGRDCYTYFYYAYDFLNPHPENPFTITFRTPLAPFFDYFLIDVLGPQLGEWLMAILFSASLGLFHGALSLHHRQAAWIASALLLIYPSYGSLFHVVSNDPPIALFFLWVFSAALWALAKPKRARFWSLGVLSGLLQLTRQGILGWIGLISLLSKPRWTHAIFFLLGLLPWVLGWSAVNYSRYGVFQFSIGTEAFLPMGRLLAVDKIVREENGPRTQELAEMIRKKLPSGVSANDYFATTARYPDLMDALDSIKKYDYHLIQQAGWEAVRAQPVIYFRGVFKTFLHVMVGNLKLPVPLKNGGRVFTHKGFVAFQKDGKDFQTSITDEALTQIQRDPKTVENFTRMGPQHLRAFETQSSFPTRNGWIGWGRLLNGLAYLFPPMLIWVFAAVWFLWQKRKLFLKEPALQGVFWIWLLALLTNFAACLGIWTAVYEYRLPFDPVFIVFPILLVFYKKTEYTAARDG